MKGLKGTGRHTVALDTALGSFKIKLGSQNNSGFLAATFNLEVE